MQLVASFELFFTGDGIAPLIVYVISVFFLKMGLNSRWVIIVPESSQLVLSRYLPNNKMKLSVVCLHSIRSRVTQLWCDNEINKKCLLSAQTDVGVS